MKMSSRFYQFCDALLRFNEQLHEQQVSVGAERLTRAECLQRWATDVRDRVAEADMVVEKGAAASKSSKAASKSGTGGT